MIQVDISNIWGRVDLPDLLALEKEVFDAHEKLSAGTGRGAEFRRWRVLASGTTPEELELFNSPVSMKNIDVLRRNPFLVKDNMVLDDLDTIVYEVNRAKKAGVNTIVDLTNIGIKRDLAKIREVSRRTGVNVIAGGGLYYSLTIEEPYRSMSA